MYIVFSTTPVGQAQPIANELVRNKLAACVQIIPQIQSVYEWKGEVCNDQESLLLIKTSEPRVMECIERLKSLHPYEVPEIVSLNADESTSLPEYLQWVRDVTGHADR